MSGLRIISSHDNNIRGSDAGIISRCCSIETYLNIKLHLSDLLMAEGEMFSLRHSGNPWQDWLQLGLHCRHIATDTGPGAPALVWSGQLTTQSCKHQLCNRIARNYGNFLKMWNGHYFGHELKLSFLWQWSEMSSTQFKIRKKIIMYHRNFQICTNDCNCSQSAVACACTR